MEDISISGVVVSYICLLFALTVHEAAHAFVAERCGDPSPRFMGRVTLNPLPHIDPIGTVVMPLLMFVMQSPFLLGWAKPVSYNPMNLKNMHRDPVLIALAGPAANLLLTLASTIALRIAVTIFGIAPVIDGPAGALLVQMMYINSLLLLFNLIPLPPLDGHYVLHYFLPEGGKRILDSIGPFGIIIVLVIVVNTPLLSVPLEALFIALSHVAVWGAS